jgi:RNA polymerase sigma-70 factor (ECF subfamily)
LNTYKHHTDEDLIHIFLEKKQNDALAELYERYSHLVLGLMLKYTRDPQKAADLMMDIFEKLPKWLEKHPIQNFKSWLYATSKNHVLMHFRKEKTEKKKLTEFAENHENNVEFLPYEHLLMTETMENLLRSGLEQLKYEQKTCLMLFYFENKSYKEIEIQTGWSFQEIKSHIQNGKRNLQLFMKKKYHE